MQEVAAELGVDYHTVSRFLNAEKPSQRLRCIRRGRKFVRITRNQLDSFVKKLETGKVQSPMKRRGK